MNNHPSRIVSIEIARAVACFVVVLSHALLVVPNTSSLTNFNLGPIAVMFFMMISGFVLSLPFVQKDNPQKFKITTYFKKRIIRIVPAYYAAIFITVIVIIFMNWEKTSFFELFKQTASHLFFIHGFFKDTVYTLNPAWSSLTLEIQYYILFPALLYLLLRLRSAVLFLSLVVLISLTFSYFFHPITLGLCFTRMAEFAAGIALAMIISNRQIIGPTHTRNTVARIFYFLGKVSYSTFLVHYTVGSIALKLIQLLGYPLNSTLLIFIYILVGHFAGILFYYLVEAPSSRFFKQWIK